MKGVPTVLLIFFCSALHTAASFNVDRGEFEPGENHSISKRATAAKTCNAELYEGALPAICNLPSAQRTLPTEAKTCQTKLKARSLSSAEAVCLWDCAYKSKKLTTSSGALDTKAITAEFTKSLDKTWLPIATDAIKTCIADANKASGMRITTGYVTKCKMASYMFNTCFRVKMLDKCPKSAQTKTFTSGRKSLSSCDFSTIIKPTAAKAHSGSAKIVAKASSVKLTKTCNSELYEGPVPSICTLPSSQKSILPEAKKCQTKLKAKSLSTAEPVCLWECAFKDKKLTTSTGALDSKAITAEFTKGMDKTWLPIATDAVKTCLTDATKASTAKLASGYSTKCKTAAYMFNTCFRVKLLDKCPKSAQSKTYAVARSALAACDYAAITKSTSQLAHSGVAALKKMKKEDLQKSLAAAQKDPNLMKNALASVPKDMLKSIDTSKLKGIDVSKINANDLTAFLGK
ncbi:Hypothetical predicted protein [Cloeon dipterum]|uniref:Uncharacterized protein n=1 Tax=Cloeon dipterum TaxID=197152 RepID=A0A8S1DHW4_9INSE|nr:Hypothetical predicted protein [Cloeon dipterum]